MSIQQTTLFQPPAQSKATDEAGYLADPLRLWLFSVQNLHPLVEVDTSAGNVVIALPAAGLNTTTGQSAQNQELTYVKKSADAHTVTITGGVGGNQVLTAQSPNANSLVKFKSNGTLWYKSGAV